MGDSDFDFGCKEGCFITGGLCTRCLAYLQVFIVINGILDEE